MKSTLILFLVAAASAQQALYSQCGGQSWNGPTTCVAGSNCVYQNQYYSQCVAGSDKPTTMVTSIKPAPTPVQPSPPAPSLPQSGGGSFSSRNGMLFDIDGTTAYFTGTNAYWISFLTNSADVDLVMSHLRSSGLKVLRVWGFNDVNATPGSGTVWFQSLVPGQNPVINTGANGLQRLDYVVASAQAHGIKLIINFVNNWDAYGGMAAYSNFYGGAHNDWYASAPIQAQYRAYIKAVVDRYANSPAIFAWELANEVRCSGCATSVITNWASSTSAYIKSLDSRHMVTLGDEGWFASGGDGSYPYQGSEGVDFVQNLAISTLDFGTYHLYPAAWGETDDWGNTWITQHASACKAANKPCIIEEYGSTTDHAGVEGKWQSTALSTKGAGTAGDMFWQYGDNLSSGNTPDDGFTIYYGTSDYSTLVINHARAV